MSPYISVSFFYFSLAAYLSCLAISSLFLLVLLVLTLFLFSGICSYLVSFLSFSCSTLQSFLGGGLILESPFLAPRLGLWTKIFLLYSNFPHLKCNLQCKCDADQCNRYSLVVIRWLNGVVVVVWLWLVVFSWG